MNLVEKINQVKIKADTRISGADRAFCERQQRAYDAAREALRELDFTWTDCISQQKMILDGEQAYTYYLGNDRNLKTACFRDELERLHEHFINRLTSYFARTYSVDLSAQSITERLLPSNSSKGIFEREKAEEAEAAYHKAMRELALRYTDVLDQIFIQLGGRSFQERAFWEIQQRCCSAVWNTYKNEPQYVQQKDIIHFYCHFCSCDADWTPPRWSTAASPARTAIPSTATPRRGWSLSSCNFYNPACCHWGAKHGILYVYRPFSQGGALWA